ncbi:uncharacterized protein LOC119140579 [Falco rusticolus]|uniref:uncharacterized protein LOC119140579 n=1 Tax=Falco rusticolus TaxID=120794 RepID=UPI001886A049|nr:uncharacterized protein LOC119140579 [Falco rusticolus]XP_055556051.1 uncharacterized protein LOC106631108 [Falco cherrug]
MSSPPLSVAVASATEASGRALQALTRLAEALGTPETVPAVLEEVKMVLAEVETALARLNAALVAALEVAAVTEMPPGLNVEGLYRALGAAADANASELERELSQNRRRRRGLWVTRSVAFVLMLVCAPLLSLDVVREALGVTQECHLVPCLATVTLVCQVALWGAGTSQRHLATAASHQRQQATRYRRLAWDTAAATAATGQATQAIAAARVTLGTSEEVAAHLKSLVDSVTEDLEMARGFPTSARALGDIVVALGTAMEDKEGTQRLARVLEALPGDE